MNINLLYDPMISLDKYYPFLSGAGYEISDFGSFCSDERHQPLGNKTECRKVTSYMGKLYTEIAEYSDWSKRCLIHFDDYIYWGSKQYAKNHEEIGEICHTSGKNISSLLGTIKLITYFQIFF